MVSDSAQTNNPNIEELLESFSRGSTRQKRSLLTSIEERVEELSGLGLDALNSFDRDGDDWCAGAILQAFKRRKPEALSTILEKFPNGWFSTPSSVGIDYGPFQEFLLSEKFEEADRFTSSVLRKLAGEGAEKRGYVYFSEVESIEPVDLTTLDRLWIAYSQGKFGFSVQARLLAGFDGRYELLWPKIGWKNDGVWTRYPSSFIWSLSAPDGHMPLINQLRGVRLMDAVINHPALLARV